MRKMKISSRVYPLILAGGEGRRFWPLSTAKKPKQFLNLCHPKKSMLLLTYERLISTVPKENIWIISHKDFWPLIKKTIPSLKRHRCLLEPAAKNTAAAIAWGATEIASVDPEATLMIMPADHWVKPNSFFRRDLKRAAHFVDRHPSALVTFGIKPTYAETGYGYLKLGKGGRVTQFVEKPDLSHAKKMIRKKNCFWNSGIFVWKARTILSEIEKYLPGLSKAFQDPNLNISSIYKKLSPVSIDKGVLEKSLAVYAIKASFQWNDLGSWQSVSLKRGKRENRLRQWISIDSHNCFIEARNKRVATIGVRDLIIVENGEDLLVCHRRDAQRVKEIAKYL